MRYYNVKIYPYTKFVKFFKTDVFLQQVEIFQRGHNVQADFQRGGVRVLHPPVDHQAQSRTFAHHRRAQKQTQHRGLRPPSGDHGLTAKLSIRKVPTEPNPAPPPPDKLLIQTFRDQKPQIPFPPRLSLPANLQPHGRKLVRHRNVSALQRTPHHFHGVNKYSSNDRRTPFPP